MSIHVSDNLGSWLIYNNLQGFLKVAEEEPHPRAKALMEEIDVSNITNKKIPALEMPRGGFDVVKKVTEEVCAPTSENIRPPPKHTRHKEVGMNSFMKLQIFYWK